ncbi:UPF0725 protein [Arabidopsis thaliana]|uniref:Uncharacterized protein n=2 Tax=Arabidopsis TaxID=3701 RepID=A0A178V6K7_ARATH|nr:Protein MS5 [Arabidopsis thaliana x Arabidopsis arenosa]OAP01318.1 hypothetical protein AXX17_AT3G51790 [Arabidopsis thaliana]
MQPSSGRRFTFQTSVYEEACGRLVLTSFIAERRRPGTIIKTSLEREFYRMASLPEFPLENPFENRNRFYVVDDESELRANDWIRLYLELSVAISDRTTTDHDLSGLRIVSVAIQTMEPPSESSLTAKNATVYIRYIDFCKARCGQNLDRIAVVRRNLQ